MEFIKPAIIEAKNNGVLAAGPYPADGFFGNGDFRKFDAILSMYHDQGLPVLKYAGFGSAVNVTLGLPFVRTSVEHGTALDLAGKDGVTTWSMAAALSLAAELAARVA